MACRPKSQFALRKREVVRGGGQGGAWGWRPSVRPPERGVRGAAAPREEDKEGVYIAIYNYIYIAIYIYMSIYSYI